MLAQAPQSSPAPRLSKFVAEALLERQGPRQIERRAREIGLPKPMVEVAVKACARAACDCRSEQTRPASAESATL